jgi:hypothetical protein
MIRCDSPTLGDPRMTTFLFRVPAEDILDRGVEVLASKNGWLGREEGV